LRIVAEREKANDEFLFKTTSIRTQTQHGAIAENRHVRYRSFVKVLPLSKRLLHSDVIKR